MTTPQQAREIIRRQYAETGRALYYPEGLAFLFDVSREKAEALLQTLASSGDLDSEAHVYYNDEVVYRGPNDDDLAGIVQMRLEEQGIEFNPAEALVYDAYSISQAWRDALEQPLQKKVAG